MLTRSPALRSPQVVTISVCGIKQDLERIAFDRVDGERGSVEGDRTFDGDELRQILWRAEAEMRHSVEIPPRHDLGDAVDMALTMWPPSSSPTFSARSRLTRSPVRHFPSVVTASVSAPTS